MHRVQARFAGLAPREAHLAHAAAAGRWRTVVAEMPAMVGELRRRVEDGRRAASAAGGGGDAGRRSHQATAARIEASPEGERLRARLAEEGIGVETLEDATQSLEHRLGIGGASIGGGHRNVGIGSHGGGQELALGTLHERAARPHRDGEGCALAGVTQPVGVRAEARPCMRMHERLARGLGHGHLVVGGAALADGLEMVGDRAVPCDAESRVPVPNGRDDADLKPPLSECFQQGLKRGVLLVEGLCGLAVAALKSECQMAGLVHRLVAAPARLHDELLKVGARGVERRLAYVGPQRGRPRHHRHLREERALVQLAVEERRVARTVPDWRAVDERLPCRRLRTRRRDSNAGVMEARTLRLRRDERREEQWHGVPT